VKSVRIPSILLLLLLGVGCAPDSFVVDIPFRVQFDGRDLACTDIDSAVALTDLRFYVHDLRLLGEGNHEIPVELIPDGIWQSDSVALLDFEDGDGACVNGSARINTVIRGLASNIDVKGLLFEIGVPEILNHADPMMATAPLSYTDMHWHWASGYKFLRGGIQTADDGFWMHLGSSRCEGTIGDIKGCRSANRPTVRLDGFEPGRHIVIVDLGMLFSGIELEDGHPSDCSSGPDEMECVMPFGELGIDFASGDSVETTRPFKIGTSE